MNGIWITWTSWLKLNFWRGKYYCDAEVATLHNKKEENKEMYLDKFILHNKSFLQVMELNKSSDSAQNNCAKWSNK